MATLEGRSLPQSHEQAAPSGGADRPPRLIVRRSGPVGQLVVSNVLRRNAGTNAMWRAFAPALAGFASDPEIRVVTVEGDGRDFMSGADIREFQTRLSQSDAIRTVEQSVSHAYRAVWDCPKPVLAIIRGYCLGGGLALATSCDMRIASEDAVFGVPAVKLGGAYPADSLVRIRALVGPAFMKEILLTGRQFTAQEALRMGLVNSVVPAAELNGKAADIVRAISEAAPMAVAAVKLVDRDLDRDPADRDVARWEAQAAACFASEDFVEGCRAFGEKRAPVFRGR